MCHFIVLIWCIVTLITLRLCLVRGEFNSMKYKLLLMYIFSLNKLFCGCLFDIRNDRIGDDMKMGRQWSASRYKKWCTWQIRYYV